MVWLSHVASIQFERGQYFAAPVSRVSGHQFQIWIEMLVEPRRGFFQLALDSRRNVMR